MGHSATGFAKRPAAKANRGRDSALAIAEADVPVVLRAIPLKLAPLVSIYKGRGKLSLRVERMPLLSRLSAGRNNGDNTWSLALDELEDLAFLLPEGMDHRHVLAIRIVAFDGVAASTLAVLDFPVVADLEEETDADDDAQTHHLQDELAKLKAVLAARDSELVETRRKAEQNSRAAQPDMRAQLAEERQRWQRDADAALAKAQAEWNASEAARLAAAEAHWRKQLADAAARCERAETALAQTRSVAASVQTDESELRLREELAEAQSALAERETALEQLRLSAEQTQQRLRQEFKTALSRAHSDWKAGETARLAAAEALSHADSKAGEAARLATAEANWRKQSESAIAELTARCERAEAALANARAQSAAPDPRDGELQNLRAELAVAQAALAERKATLAQTRVAAEQTQERLRQEHETALAEMTARCERAEIALAAARAQSAAPDPRDGELQDLRAELAVSQAALAERKALLAQTRVAADETQDRLRREHETALAKAKADWAGAEAARFSAAEENWRNQSARTLVDATARFEKAETALAELRAAHEDLRARGQRELEAALSQAKANWKASEAPRLSAAEMNWRQQLDDARERYETAEAALAQLRVKMDAARLHTGESKIGHLQAEIAALQATLAGRDAELAEARSAIATRGQPEPRIVIQQDRARLVDDPEPPKRSHLMRDAIIAAALAAMAIVFYPTLEGFIPEEWQSSIFGQPEAAPLPPPAPAPPRVVEQHMAVIVHNGNVRAEPSKEAAIVSTLQRGLKIAIVEQRGNWTSVQVAGKDGKSQQGWVYSSLLKTEDASSTPPPAKSK
ncbi:MAG TPA: SH3 domain-containing protein [Rhizomicrobium sp.]|nr:SH3 domain-containing protein [Rhizomicrobium sp.]